MGDPIVVSTGHVDAPWVTADLAVLNETAMDVRLDVDLQLLAAEWACDQELVWHCAILLQCARQVGMKSATNPRG